MKKQLLLFLSFANLMLVAQTTETVSMGPGYANDVYYSLSTGLVKTEPRNNWHIAFTARLIDAAVWTNEGLGVELYEYSSDTNDFGSIDTTGLAWNMLYNSPSIWEEGSLNDLAGTHPDYGWGEYRTGNVYGTKVFIMKLENDDYKQIMIRSMLSNGDFTFRIADLDGSNEIVRTGNKFDYSSKNFFYYDVINDTIIDREPNSADWDILFTRHLEEIIPFTYYTVTGAYINLDVVAAKAESVDTNAVDFRNYPVTDSITIIGSDWKSFNNGTFQWSITDSLAYFVQGLDGNLYKMIFADFGGSATGNIVFKKTVASSIGIDEVDAFEAIIYPQPASAALNIDLNAEGVASLYALTGEKVGEYKLARGTSNIDVASLKAGMYILQITANGQTRATRVVVQ